MISSRLRTALEAALGARVERVSPLGGGDISQTYTAELSDNRTVFLKTHASAPPLMFPAEAAGLRWLAEAEAIRVPEVLAVSRPESSELAFLVLEFLRTAPRDPEFDVKLGRSLALLHRKTPARFGLDHPNFIAVLPQSNAPHPTWAEFYRAERLEPQLRRAVQSGALSAAVPRGFDRLFAKLEELAGPPEPPARLHGDLWGGNLHVDERGQPCLVDPAVYGGHREVDLAMMRLFGGFGERVFAAYHETYPLATGHAERVPLYQLYPLLVHTNLFGGSYPSAVERGLAHYGCL